MGVPHGRMNRHGSPIVGVGDFSRGILQHLTDDPMSMDVLLIQLPGEKGMGECLGGCRVHTGLVDYADEFFASLVETLDLGVAYLVIRLGIYGGYEVSLHARQGFSVIGYRIGILRPILIRLKVILYVSKGVLQLEGLVAQVVQPQGKPFGVGRNVLHYASALGLKVGVGFILRLEIQEVALGVPLGVAVVVEINDVLEVPGTLGGLP